MKKMAVCPSMTGSKSIPCTALERSNFQGSAIVWYLASIWQTMPAVMLQQHYMRLTQMGMPRFCCEREKSLRRVMR